MTTNKTSWEIIQRKRLALDCAKDAKANYAQELEQLRLTLDYMRSLRHWMTVASSHRTLKARKAVFAGHLERINAMADRRTAIEYCAANLVPANCRENIRNAISWDHTATSSPTFKDWQECCDSAGDCIGDAMCQLAVVQSRVKSSWKQARANMIAARTVIDTCAKDILHPVALPKAVRKEMVRVYCAKQQVKVFPKGIQNLTLYRFACAPTNNYHLVSAAACISQRAEGTVLGLKLWLRLVRTTRSNHTHRNAHNLNNRQDYLSRLPVDTNKVICLR